MKQEVIDGSVPISAVTLYEVPELADDLDVDFLSTRDLEEIEEGIRQIQYTGDLLALVQGIAICKIEREGLWMQADYPNLRAYRIDQLERLGMPKSTVSRRRQVGEGFLDNRKSLGKFPLHGHVEKLRYLNEAVRRFGKRDAVGKFKTMSFREFVDWVRPLGIAEYLPTVDVALSDDGILVGGEAALLWPTEYPVRERKWLGSVVEKAFKARAGGNLAHVVSVYDAGEARAVDLFLKRHRESK